MKAIPAFTNTCLVCALSIEAATFRAPIHAVGRNATASKARRLQLSNYEVEDLDNNSSRVPPQEGSQGRRLRGPGRNQKPLNSDKGDAAKSDGNYWSCWSDDWTSSLGYDTDAGLELWDWNELSYITTLSLGTPPQPFNMLLSISSPDLFVPSASCRWSCNDHQKYHASASSTHKQHGDYMRGLYLRSDMYGPLSEDTLHIAGMEIQSQSFGEATEINRNMPDFGNEEWDGILGLSPSNEASDLRTSSPFQNMVAQELLDWNLFSLKLPRGREDPGEILFGGIDESMYKGKLKKLPLVPYTPNKYQCIKGRWIVPASAIGIGDGFGSLNGYVATIETDYPFISLPENYVMLLEKQLGFEPGNRHGDGGDFLSTIDCAKRKEMEDVKIVLAGEEFVLNSFDYVLEIEKKVLDQGVDMEGNGNGNGERDKEAVCVSAFLPWREDFQDEKYIVLGTAFLRAHYGIFDLDGKTVSFGKVVRRSENQEGREEL